MKTRTTMVMPTQKLHLQCNAKTRKEQSPEDTCGINKSRNPEVLPKVVGIGAEQNKKSDTCADEEPCHHLAGLQKTVKIELCNHDRGSTVGNQTDCGGQENAGGAVIGQKSPDGILTEAFDNECENQRDQENEQRDVQRVNKGGFQNASLFLLTAAVLLLTKVMDVLLMIALFMLMQANSMENTVDDQTGQRSDDCLYGKNSCHLSDGKLRGDEQREHFIGSGKKNSKEGSCRNQTGGVKTGSRGGEAALRNNADDSAEDGTEAADVFFPDEVLGLILGTPLQGLHDQISNKQERDQFQGVDSCIQQGIGEKLE